MSLLHQRAPSVSATTQLSFREGSLQRLTRSQDEFGQVKEQWHDLFSNVGDSRKFSPLENLTMSAQHAEANGLELEQQVVELDFRHARIWDRSHSGSFYRSHLMAGVDDNPIVEFIQQGQRILVDFATVVQFFIAPNRRCFETLVSPLGAMAMRCEANTDYTLIDLSWEAWQTFDEDPGSNMAWQGQPIAPNVAQCLAYWGSDPDRHFQLRLWYSRLAHDGEIHLPPVDLPFRTSSHGWNTPDGFLIKRLLRPHGAQWWDQSDAALFAVLRGRDTGWIYGCGRHVARVSRLVSGRRLPTKVDRATVMALMSNLRPGRTDRSFARS